MSYAAMLSPFSMPYPKQGEVLKVYKGYHNFAHGTVLETESSVQRGDLLCVTKNEGGIISVWPCSKRNILSTKTNVSAGCSFVGGCGDFQIAQDFSLISLKSWHETQQSHNHETSVSRAFFNFPSGIDRVSNVCLRISVKTRGQATKIHPSSIVTVFGINSTSDFRPTIPTDYYYKWLQGNITVNNSNLTIFRIGVNSTEFNGYQYIGVEFQADKYQGEYPDLNIGILQYDSMWLEGYKKDKIYYYDSTLCCHGVALTSEASDGSLTAKMINTTPSEDYHISYLNL